MVDFNINIQADAANAQRTFTTVSRSLRNLERTADRTRAIVGAVFTGLGAAGGIAEIVTLSDTYTQLQNRIRVVTNSQQELDAATQSLFDISQQTRSSFEGTAEIYSRLSLASRELGVTQDETLQFTESLNQAIISSGVTAREANAGLIQLSQGIASNALRGDELRSVLEQLPVVADIIANELGVTRGALRDLGAQGSITGEVIINAFQNSREEIKNLFQRTVPTLQQSLVVLQNSLIRTFGQLDQGVAGTQTLSRIIINLANNMETLARAAISTAVAISINLAGIAIPRAIAAIRALTAVIAANPFGAIAVAITAVIGFLVGFSDRIMLVEGSIVTLRDVFSAFIIEAGIALSGITAVFSEVFTSISERFSVLIDFLNIGLEGWLIVGARTADDFVELFFRTFRAVNALWEQFPATIDTIFSRAFNNAIGTVESSLNRISNAIINSGLGSFFGLEGGDFSITLPRFEVQDVSTIQDLADTVRNTFNEELGLDATEQFVNRVIARSKEIAKARLAAAEANTEQASLFDGAVDRQNQLSTSLQRVSQRLQDIIAGLRMEGELLRLNNDEREIQTDLYQIQQQIVGNLIGQEREAALALFATQEDNIEQLLRQNQFLQGQADIYDDINKPVTNYLTTLTALNELLAKGKINQLEFNNALAGTDLVQSLQQLETDLDPFGEFGSTQALEEQLNSRLLLIQQSQQVGLRTKQEALNLSLEAHRAYNNAIIDLETSRSSAQIQLAQSTSASLTQITGALVGEQSSAYRALFAVTKAFALSDSAIQIANALAKALNTPFPTNLAAIGIVASEAASIVSTIQSTTLAGFQNGGSFRVGGAGGTDSQLVQFMASPNETVSVRTPGQERQVAAQQHAQGTTQQDINLNVQLASGLVAQEIEEDPSSERAIISIIERNSRSISNILNNR